jgi:hypothetical protein
MRVMLDTMGYDKLIADHVALRRVLSSIRAGRLSIISTHIQRDQLQRIPDPAKRTQVFAIPTVQILTS